MRKDLSKVCFIFIVINCLLEDDHHLALVKINSLFFPKSIFCALNRVHTNPGNVLVTILSN